MEYVICLKIIIYLVFKIEAIFSYKLISTVIILRHGDRSPVWIYPTDIYDNKKWHYGLGELTKHGIYEAYLLGKFINKRYIYEKNLINVSFKYDEVFVRSTDVDRTLMTIQATLAALYPPFDSLDYEQIWNKKLNWQPIPIHTIPLKNDFLLNGGSSCKLFTELENKLWDNDKEAIEINTKYKYFFKFIEDHTGIKPFKFNVFDILADPLISEVSYNLSQPNWLNYSTINFIFKLHNIKFIMNYKYKKMFELAAGSLMEEIVKIFQTHISIYESTNISNFSGNLKHKLHLFSGHDTTITSTLSFLNSFMLNPSISSPNFCSSLFFELYVDQKKELSQKQYYIKLFYRNYPLVFTNLSHSPFNNSGYIKRNYTLVNLKLPDCPEEYCQIQNFLSYVVPKIPKNIEKECNKPLFMTYCEETKSKWAICYIIFPLFTIISIILITWGLFLCFWKTRNGILISQSTRSISPLEVFVSPNEMITDDNFEEPETDERTNLLHQK